MCGLIFIGPKKSLSDGNHLNYGDFRSSFIKSTRRGQDSSGLCISIVDGKKHRKITVFKINSSSKELLSSYEFRKFIKQYPFESWEFAIGHTRMNTDGNSYDINNNQPLIQNKDLLVFNGIIVNAKDFLELQNLNDGFSLFKVSASEKYLSDYEGIINLIKFNEAKETIEIYSRNDNLFITETDPSLIVSEPTFSTHATVLVSEKIISLEKINTTTVEERVIDTKSKPVIVGGVNYKTKHSAFERSFSEIKGFFDQNLVRCKTCLLPSTHPFIHFNEIGVCNFCENNEPQKLKPASIFEEKISSLKNENVLLGLSGGRDSCLALHELVTKYDCKPLTYTYDWGVNTDLSRRNVSRMCGALKVENILISADLRKKRRNVRMNLSAWFKRPILGLLPLLMAGDKQFISNAAILKKERGISAEIFAFNLHEKTQFKEELTGIKMWSDEGNAYGEDLPLSKQIALLWFYGKEALFNPRLLNISITDSLLGFFNYYHSDVDIIQFFEYHRWNENYLENTLRNNYDWEFALDTPTSWRIGDGTAAFYNLAYYMQLGFTENDVIRSNLIRAGQMTRQEALELVEQENRPRIPTLEWYCKVIQLNFEDVLSNLLGTHSYAR